MTVNSNALYAAGFLLYLREQTLMAQPFNAAKLSTTGDPVPVAGFVGYNNDGLAMRGLFSVSRGGVLAYVSGGFFTSYSSATDVVQLTWFDRTGKMLGTTGTPAIQSRGAISPDGHTVAVAGRDPLAPFLDIWVDDLARGTASRFTFGPRSNNSPVWSPDGLHIAFSSNRDSGSGLWKVGSPQEFVTSGILRGFPGFLKSDVFGVGHGYAPCFQQEVTHVLIAAAAVDQHTDVTVDRFYDSEANLGPAVVQNPFEVFEQHVRELLKGGQSLPS